VSRQWATWGLAATLAAVALLAAASPARAQLDPGEEAAKGLPVSVVKLVLSALLFVALAAFGNWLGRDVAMIQSQQRMWCGAYLGAAGLGLLLLLLVPWFAVGWVLALAAVSAPAAAYVKWRNERVPPGARAFTRAHVRHAVLRLLRREEEGEIAAERAVHIDGATHLTQEFKLLYMHSNEMPIRLTAQSEEEQAAFARGEMILYEALAREAEQFFLVPHGSVVYVRYRIDNAVRDGGRLERKLGEGVIAFIKRLASLDPQERRKPQMGRFIALLGDKPTYITVEAAGSVRGEHLQAKLHARQLLRMRLTESGMRAEQAELLRAAMASPAGGIILMSGPRHSGRTVSMYAALREIDLFSRNVLAVEQQVSIDIPDVTQRSVDKASGQTLAGAVQDALRTDPDVVMVETVADGETARMLLTGAAAGKLMIGGLVAGDAAEAVEGFVRLAGDRQSVGATIRAATCQRLVRTLCPACREAYRPNPDFLRKANLQSSQVDVLYREPKSRPVDKKGQVLVCPMCRNEGYVGHTVFYEVLLFDEEARRQLAAGGTMAEVRTMLRKKGQEFLQEEGLRKVVAGVTSVTELLRVIKGS